ncbi:MAG: N-6 DNA methylase, partial [Methanophagales archaeon]|nr:N-6 DNA methylase [Methanophagales archaeon]
PLPNIDYNLRVGNSLIGYVDLSEFKEARITISDFLGDREKATLDNLLKERNDLIRKYKRAEGEEANELKGLVHEFDGKISNMLNTDLYQRFQEKKIKISKEEFLKLDPFHWGFEFYEVFDLDRQKEERGFDAVIGNPPYGAELNRIEKIWLKKRHECNRANNSAEYFFEKCFELIVQSGLVGYIVPKTIGFYSAWEDIRKYLLSKKVTHLFDVGIGFVGVNYEELVIIVKNQEYATFEESIVLIDKSENLKRATGIKDAIFSGRLTQKLMRRHNKLIFSPINSPEDEIIAYMEKSNIKFREIYNRAFRGLYISDKEKAQLKIGDISWIDKVPHVKRYYLSHIMKINIEKTEWQKKIEDIMVPRIFFKVLRGKRLVCFIDDKGKFLTTEKLVNVTLKDSSNYKLQTLMLILNSPLPSFYIQKMLFSDTTETSRVMDDIYVGETPIPHPAPKNQQSFITLCNYMLFLNETEERRKDEKELIGFIDKQVID